MKAFTPISLVTGAAAAVLFFAAGPGVLAAPVAAVVGTTSIRTTSTTTSSSVHINQPHPRDNNNGGGGGETRHGAMTYYTVGMGACGQDDSGKGDTDNIVALSADLMDGSGGGGGDGGGDGTSEMCGRKVTIHGANGREVQAVVRDKCPSCAPGHLDVSEKVFKDLTGDLGLGRSEITWSFSS